MERVQFTAEIDAPVSLVEEAMLGRYSYNHWTSAFNASSHFEGGWNKGDKIKFVGVNKDGKKEGMAGLIRDRIPGKLVEIEYYGLVDGDNIVTEGKVIEEWSGKEIYHFSGHNGKTSLRVELDVNDEYKDYFNTTWPKALQLLKAKAEQQIIRRPYPCFWFNGQQQAKEAAELYCSLFPGSSIGDCNGLVVNFEIGSLQVMLLDAGPLFRPNSTLSLYATFEKKEEIDHAWMALSADGVIKMPLQQYPWSNYYGWVEDKHGVNWQLTLGKLDEVGQQVVPLLMFCGEHQNQADKAIEFYTHLFRDAEKFMAVKYQPGQSQNNADIVHARFRLGNTLFMAMDSGVNQPFTFNEGASLVITCDTQREIDFYWDALSSNGVEGQCGWVRDQFGVWWQVVPAVLGEFMSNPATRPAVQAAFMKMKKFDIATLEKAARNG